MSTRAQVDMMHRNKKTYRFWIYRDGHPSGASMSWGTGFISHRITRITRIFVVCEMKLSTRRRGDSLDSRGDITGLCSKNAKI